VGSVEFGDEVMGDSGPFESSVSRSKSERRDALTHANAVRDAEGFDDARRCA
jgi:hypothetical protein